MGNTDADDGQTGETDDVTYTVENLVGGTGNDTLTGSDVVNVISGGAGNDLIDGVSNTACPVGAGDVLNDDVNDDTILDSSLQLSVGNVFDAHLADLSARDLRLAFAVGIHTAGIGLQSLSLLFGGGTDTFRQGGHLGEVRAAAGLKQGF